MADYFVEGGDVLENKLSITDPEQLHGRLFGKVYPFCWSNQNSKYYETRQ